MAEFSSAEKINTVIFDLDGTLRFNVPSGSQFFLNHAVSLGLTDSAEKRREAIRWTHYYFAMSPELLSDLKIYPEETIFWNHYSERFLQAFGCTSEVTQKLGPQMHQYMLDEHRPQASVPPDVHQTLRALKKTGYNLGLVSNREKSCNEELKELELGGYFDLVLVAGEAKSWKPDAAIFKMALTQLEVEASQAVYVGDNYFADIIGARRAGMYPVLLDLDDIFTDVDCQVISSLGQICDLLPGCSKVE